MLWWLDWRRSIVNSHELCVLSRVTWCSVSQARMLFFPMSCLPTATLLSNLRRCYVLSRVSLARFCRSSRFQNKKKVDILNPSSRDSGWVLAFLLGRVRRWIWRIPQDIVPVFRGVSSTTVASWGFHSRSLSAQWQMTRGGRKKGKTKIIIPQTFELCNLVRFFPSWRYRKVNNVSDFRKISMTVFSVSSRL